MPYSPDVSGPEPSEASDVRLRTDLLSALSGVLALGAGAAAIGPWDIVAWPALTLGLLALGLSRRPGGAAARAIGAFSGLLGLAFGALRIAILYGAAEILR